MITPLFLSQKYDLLSEPEDGCQLLFDVSFDSATLLITGPEDSPYAGGLFLVTIYDEASGTQCVQFHTTVFSPHVSSEGYMVMYPQDDSLRGKIQEVRRLLRQPKWSFATNREAADWYFCSERLFSQRDIMSLRRMRKHCRPLSSAVADSVTTMARTVRLTQISDMVQADKGILLSLVHSDTHSVDSLRHELDKAAECTHSLLIENARLRTRLNTELRTH